MQCPLRVYDLWCMFTDFLKIAFMVQYFSVCKLFTVVLQKKELNG